MCIPASRNKYLLARGKKNVPKNAHARGNKDVLASGKKDVLASEKEDVLAF